MKAVQAGHAEIASYLLVSGADIAIKNSAGETAQQIAEVNGKQTIISLFAK